MLFNSYTFIIFFIFVLLIHYSKLSWNTKKGFLVFESYIFYAAWNPPFIILLLFTTFSDWILARAISKAENRSKRKFLLIISLCMSLGLLSYFKYGTFFLQNFVILLNSAGIVFHPANPNIVLPVGISFYTFHTLSYVIDIYSRKYKPWPSFVDYALYVSFFPQLVAGPILRAPDFLPQCVGERRATKKQLEFGLALLITGLFEKVVMADGIFAPISDLIYAVSGKPDFFSAWIGTFSFAGQIFFDFAGYSSCAIGTALCLGFHVKKNFNFPYSATDFSDFWKRWHISLSSFLRDYLYIPLGGNRKGKFRTYYNLMLTMLLGGLWHGASWTFVVWGGLHGLYQVVERLLKHIKSGDEFWEKPVGFYIKTSIVFILVNIAWVFFRSSTFSHAFEILSSMFGFINNSKIHISGWQLILGFGSTVIMLIIHRLMRNSSTESLFAGTPWWLRSIILAVMLFSMITLSGDDRAFIYFQF